MTTDAERAAIDRVPQRLSTRFPTLAPAVVARVVRDTHRRFPLCQACLRHHPVYRVCE